MNEAFLAGLVVAGRSCVVIGGDREAGDKARRLVAAGANVCVVAPRLDDDGLGALAATGAVAWRAREHTLDDVRGAFLVVYTPNDPAAARVLFAGACAPGGYLLCAVDQPAYCTFTNVALVRRGPLQIGIATGGGAPLLAARLRAALEAHLGPDFAAFAQRLAALRATTSPQARRAVMARALEGFAFSVAYQLPDEPAVRRSGRD